MREPVRTCVACRTRRPQRALVRVRRRSDGVVVPAVGRRTHGRSAYLCPTPACFDTAARRSAVERALGKSGKVRPLPPHTLRPQVLAAIDLEIQTLQRSGDISRSPRYDALSSLRRGLCEPGRPA